MRRISGIHNYCTRWCERCPLGHRCAVNDKHAGDEEWIEKLQSTTQAPTVKEQNVFDEIDWEKVDDFIEESEKKEAHSKAKFDPYQHPLSGIARNAAKAISKLLSFLEKHLRKEPELKLEMLEERELIQLDNCQEILRWYLVFLQSKTIRALSGKYDEFEDNNPVQNDWNGTAKILIMAVGHVRGAAQQILVLLPEFEDETLPLLAITDTMLRELDREFPRADEFKRPGFDDLGVQENYGV